MTVLFSDIEEAAKQHGDAILHTQCCPSHPLTQHRFPNVVFRPDAQHGALRAGNHAQYRDAGQTGSPARCIRNLCRCWCQCVGGGAQPFCDGLGGEFSPFRHNH